MEINSDTYEPFHAKDWIGAWKKKYDEDKSFHPLLLAAEIIRKFFAQA